MKRIIALLLLIGLSMVYSRAYSAPSCINFIQGKSDPLLSEQFEMGQRIQAELPEYNLSRSDFYKTHSLHAEISLGFLNMGWKRADVEIQITSNERADIIIKPHNQKHVDRALNKAQRIYNSIIEDFNNTSITGTLEAPIQASDPHTGETIIYMSLAKLTPAREAILTSLLRRSLGLKIIPQKKHWNFETENLQGTIYHVPKRLEHHQTPRALESERNHLVSVYARPKNLPVHIKNFFDTASGFKMILNRDRWIVESLYEAQNVGGKTLMLSITPDGRVEVLKDTPYETNNKIEYTDNLHSYILARGFKGVSVSKGPSITLRIEDLLGLFGGLEASGFTFMQPPSNPNIFPFKSLTGD